ncbi:class I SAM-dependent methyltransferase [Sciscionella marina]|uniref:class I SAM-dependent methyltransferase n=1 Tax=Sciscionella marina TaxID=508770 RepID=UPI0012F68D0E|nr:class I SAM-dependent methyltransferase [Sciscionella marina]
MDTARDRKHWTEVAEQWIAWARTPGHDVFWNYLGALHEFLGEGKGNVLDVGCGEGRVSRELRALGYTVTAVDVVETLVEAARAADSADAYRVAPITGLPFADGTFDKVVSYNMLMDVDDLPGAARELARVLADRGEVFVSVVHPFTEQVMETEGRSYFEQKRFDSVDSRDGLTMRFSGWARPLQDYITALNTAGLAVTAVREPAIAGVDANNPASRWATEPLFLWFTLRKLPADLGLDHPRQLSHHR